MNIIASDQKTPIAEHDYSFRLFELEEIIDVELMDGTIGKSKKSLGSFNLYQLEQERNSIIERNAKILEPIEAKIEAIKDKIAESK